MAVPALPAPATRIRISRPVRLSPPVDTDPDCMSAGGERWPAALRTYHVLPACPAIELADGRLMRRRQHAELVALGVGEHDPGLLALSDVDPLRAEADEALDLRITIIRAEVKVQPILRRPPL